MQAAHKSAGNQPKRTGFSGCSLSRNSSCATTRLALLSSMGLQAMRESASNERTRHARQADNRHAYGWAMSRCSEGG